MPALTHAAAASVADSSFGSSYPFILEHILTYPGTYEIPLRTMYTLNCAPRAQLPFKQSHSASKSLSTCQTQTAGKSLAHDAHPKQMSAPQFTSSLMTQIAQLPVQPCSLPPAFITSFVRRCFTADLTKVDFPQALTGLDYLKDLEHRRRRELRSAFSRLELGRQSVEQSTSQAIAAWVRSMEEKEKKIEALYTQLYIALRRWTLINELSLLPFNKHNCIAMLNTLYPPAVSAQPTSQLRPEVLESQRSGFFKYIQAVDKSGPHVLQNLMQQGKRKESDPNGWPAVREVVEAYLRAANSVIEECSRVTGIEVFVYDDKENRGGRKVDSGISFGSVQRPSTDRPSTSSSVHSHKNKRSTSKLTDANTAKPLPAITKTSSTLEKIARELRRLKGRTNNVFAAEDVVRQDAAPKPAPTHSRLVRRMQSLGDLRSRNASSPNLSPNKKLRADDLPFDKDEMRRQRLIYEAKAGKSSATPTLSSFEV